MSFYLFLSFEKCVLLMVIRAAVKCDTLYQKHDSRIPSVTHSSNSQFIHVTKYELHDERMTWHNADTMCSDLGGQLPLIESDSDRQTVLIIASSLLKKSPIWVGYSGTYEYKWKMVLILGKDQDNEDKPFFNNGDYIIAENGKPNNNSYDCVTLWSEGAVDDDDCNKELPFICNITT